MNFNIILAFVVGCGVGYGVYYISCFTNKNAKKDSMVVFNENIFQLVQENTLFRRELVTGKHSQVVIMSIPVGSEIGMERHEVDQTLVFVQGHGQAIINGQVSDVRTHHLVFVPAGTDHNFKNVGPEELKLFTVYAPAQHKPGTIQKERTAYD